VVQPPDLIASILLSGRTPNVMRAVRFTASPTKQAAMQPVRLRGEVEVDPARDDFFARVVEARQHIKISTRDHPDTCRCQNAPPRRS
jgi:hypothetical protein